MDEPTNHLDLEAIIWLEEFLSTWKGGLIMISHDRQFLDKSINNVLELDRGSATVFVGNYTRYVEIKEERHILQESAFKNQQKKTPLPLPRVSEITEVSKRPAPKINGAEFTYCPVEL